MRFLPARLLGAALLCSLSATASADESDSEDPEDREDLVLRIIGQTAQVAIMDDDIMIEAKVDTGADSTTIDAREIETFERDGKDWVRFEVPLNDAESVRFERPIEGDVEIRRAGQENEERHVVLMDLCVADVSLETEVNLSNREGLDYRMLLGRGFMIRGNFLVNPGQKSEVRPRCEQLLGN